MLIAGNKQPFTKDEIATASPLGGVYVLYAGEKIVFIGCAGSSEPDGIRGRLAEHLHGVHETEMSGLTHFLWVNSSSLHESKLRLLVQYKDKHGELPWYNTLAECM